MTAQEQYQIDMGRLAFAMKIMSVLAIVACVWFAYAAN